MKIWKSIFSSMMILLLLTSCGISSKQEPTSPAASLQNEENLLANSDYYKITYKNQQYIYELYDINGKMVQHQEIFREPKITMTDEGLVQVTIQMGSGITTREAYFLNPQNGQISETYKCFYDAYNGKVLYGDYRTVYYKDIFTGSPVEITELKNLISKNAAEPILEAKFSREKNAVQIKYISQETEQPTDIQISLENK